VWWIGSIDTASLQHNKITSQRLFVCFVVCVCVWFFFWGGEFFFRLFVVFLWTDGDGVRWLLLAVATLHITCYTTVLTQWVRSTLVQKPLFTQTDQLKKKEKEKNKDRATVCFGSISPVSLCSGVFQQMLLQFIAVQAVCIAEKAELGRHFIMRMKRMHVQLVKTVKIIPANFAGHHVKFHHLSFMQPVTWHEIIDNINSEPQGFSTSYDVPNDRRMVTHTLFG
jgi:hypothetical protein